MKFGKKFAVSSKTNLIVNLYTIKNIKKLKKKKINTKECLQCIFIRVILIDSVYRKYFFIVIEEKDV